MKPYGKCINIGFLPYFNVRIFYWWPDDVHERPKHIAVSKRKGSCVRLIMNDLFLKVLWNIFRWIINLTRKDEQKDSILLSLILNELTTSLFLFDFLRTVLQESLTVNKVGEGNI